MGILHIEHRVVLRGFDHFGEVEVHLRIGLAGEHGEAHHVLAHFVDHIGQRHEIARALGHFHRLAVAQQLDHLHELDFEGLGRLAFGAGQRRDGGLDALDGAGMVGAPDVDEGVGGLGLLEVVGKSAPK
jgi:hypothetical protein